MSQDLSLSDSTKFQPQALSRILYKLLINGSFFFLAAQRGLWHLSSQTGDQTQARGNESTES